MQTATVNDQHATPPLLDRLLDEALGLMSSGIRSRAVQIQLGFRLNLAARERADQVMGHAKSCTRQVLALPIHLQRFTQRSLPRDRDWRRRYRWPLRHGAAGPGRQRSYPLHRRREKPAVFFLGDLPGGSGRCW
jgi:hypothetical protein